MGREQEITREVKKHDSKLYCAKNREGTLCIYRKTLSSRSYRLDDGTVLTDLRPTPHFVFALTDTWTKKGRPVHIGCHTVMSRLRQMDLWRNENLVEDLIKDYEADAKSSERSFDNNTEAFLKDFRRQFAKAFNDVNTSTLDKKKDRRFKDGNSK